MKLKGCHFLSVKRNFFHSLPGLLSGGLAPVGALLSSRFVTPVWRTGVDNDKKKQKKKCKNYNLDLHSREKVRIDGASSTISKHMHLF